MLSPAKPSCRVRTSPLSVAERVGTIIAAAMESPAQVIARLLRCGSSTFRPIRLLTVAKRLATPDQLLSGVSIEDTIQLRWFIWVGTRTIKLSLG